MRSVIRVVATSTRKSFIKAGEVKLDKKGIKLHHWNTGKRVKSNKGVSTERRRATPINKIDLNKKLLQVGRSSKEFIQPHKIKGYFMEVCFQGRTNSLDHG